jgi:membrane-bound lytic murein transglycosylase F
VRRAIPGILLLLLTACQPETKAPTAEEARLAREAAERAAAYAANAERARQLAQSASDAAGEMRKFRYIESGQFQKRLAARLNPYRPWFERAAAEIGVDWRLLAAISYQESRWDTFAESPNGAAGLMMLTESTARELKVTDRNNPRQSIFGGARYFAQMHRKLPKRIPEPDRSWLAVAAYNVGFGHLEDARVLTQMRGRNPDSWDDVREHLPLLEDPTWHTRVKRGYARGSEPVQFVARVQRFMVLLDWQTGEAAVLEEIVSVD